MPGYIYICTHNGPFRVIQVMVGHSTESEAGLPFLHNQVMTGHDTESEATLPFLHK